MKLPQLSLRDLFWLVLVCALGFGWFVDRAGNHFGRQHLIEGFEGANDMLYKQEQAATAAGYRFDYSKGKVVLIPMSTP